MYQESTHTLSDNYVYINEDKIPNSLICIIGLHPLVDPQTHVLCQSSFCNRCIRKLRYCPCCQSTIEDLNDLKMANSDIRNNLNELQVKILSNLYLCNG